MTLAITFGWWLIPAAITLAVVVYGFWPEPATRGWGDLGSAMVGAFRLMAGIILALAAWLVWALAS
jgi:hypothetical protein